MVAGAIVEHGGEILLLQRSEQESHPLKRCVPWGGVDHNETPLEAVIREVKEEAGIVIDEVKKVCELYYRADRGDFHYHLFHHQASEKSRVILDTQEHIDHKRMTPHAILHTTEMELISGLDFKIKMMYDIA